MNIRFALAAAIACVASGLLLWPIPYADLQLLSNPALLAWGAEAVVAGIFAGLILRSNALHAAGAVGLGFGLSMLGRVLVDVGRDATTHNLWPLAVAIAVVVGLAAGAVGVAAARLTVRLVQRRLGTAQDQPADPVTPAL